MSLTWVFLQTYKYLGHSISTAESWKADQKCLLLPMTVTMMAHLLNSTSNMVQHCNIDLNGQKDDLCHIPCKRWKANHF